MPTLTSTPVRAALLACSVLLPLHAAAQTKVLINPGDQGEQSRFAVFSQWKAAVQQGLSRAEPGGAPAVRLSIDTTADLSATRSRGPDVIVGPAHLIGSAVRYGYTPVVGLQRVQQTVLVVHESSGIRNFAQTRGARLGLPPQDSLVTYLVRGEANAANTTIKRHFSEVYETRYQDALLTCLQVRRCEVVAVERALFDRWKAAGEPLRVVMESRSVPAMSVAVKQGGGVAPEALRKSVAEALTGLAGAGAGADHVQPGPVAAADFAYVSTLGYFTPRSLQGATVVDAASVDRLLKGGARYIDTRNTAEFDEGHVPTATLVPYVEKSAKDPDFVAAQDQFDVGKLGSDRDAELVFGCNGPECWKSHKASIAAIKAGFTHVYWFRGGFPEWRAYMPQGDQMARTGSGNVVQ